jgi:hypothetical protein
MAIVTDIRVDGLKEIEARLVELDAISGARLVTRATRRSLIALEKRATANAASIAKSGALAESVSIVTVRPKGNEVAAVQVGPRKKSRKGVAVHNLYYGRKRKGIFYGHLIEFGHRIGHRKTGWLRKGNRSAGAGGSSAGAVAARPWFGPAWNATRAGVIPEFRRIMAEGMRRIERRAKRRDADTDRTVDR